MIVISNPIFIKNEISTIHTLFENGLELFHLRKPEFTKLEMKAFLSEIKADYRQNLVVHSHHQLAVAFGIHRLHFTEKKRNETPEESLRKWKEKRFTLSTSIHRMADFEKLSVVFDYAFFGPVFESISKPNYISDIDFEKELKQRKNNKSSLIAVGGITSERVKTALDYGFDDVALLGTIWNSNNPIENFKLCQQIALSS
ncbi:thiamine phosphate synthase [Flavobacterium sandaracinum]|uniref:Thiamine phosphate synthase n=1 Tax=Flavobacterium sandaracinum TaxID=2541733 RepID=A0A4V2Z1K3_9FLAO|nr:thiamine phosphate synthase [Flavobacterium sandaracinum]TDE05188.1 thiamine phosphate synthase [Flavobacterium sandaracinum]